MSCDRFKVYTEGTGDEGANQIDSLHRRCLAGLAEQFGETAWRLVSVNTYVRRNYHRYPHVYVTVVGEALGRDAANVYSDWLEERGHDKAAAALRKTFPLATGE